MNLPNKLSLTRILLLFPVVILLLIDRTMMGEIDLGFAIIPQTHFYAMIVFVVASFSDFLDGYIARKYDLITTFGKFIDPIADKLLVNAAFIIFTYFGYIPVWITLIIILRDTIVDSVRMFLASQNIVVAANWWGKFKTIFQMIALPLIFIFNIETLRVDDLELVKHLIFIPLYLATFFSALSGAIYFIQGWPHIAKSK